jgi:ABC-type multidrug transport system ATPase subunit
MCGSLGWASRRSLRGVVRSNKAGRGVLLTTHSMEEAQVIYSINLPCTVPARV